MEESPNGKFPGPREPIAANSPPPVHDYQNFQMYLQKRAGENEGRSSSSNQQHHCDGHDDMGCFRVLIYIFFYGRNIFFD